MLQPGDASDKWVPAFAGMLQKTAGRKRKRPEQARPSSAIENG